MAYSLLFCSFTMMWLVMSLTYLGLDIVHLFWKILRHYLFKQCFCLHFLSTLFLYFWSSSHTQLELCHLSCVSLNQSFLIFYSFFFFVFWSEYSLLSCLIILTLFLPVFNLQLNSSIEFLILIIVFFSFRISALFLFYGFYFSGKVIFSSMFWTYLPVFDNSNTWIIYGSFFLSFRYDFLVYLIIFCWMPDILYEKL